MESRRAKVVILDFGKSTDGIQATGLHIDYTDTDWAHDARLLAVGGGVLARSGHRDKHRDVPQKHAIFFQAADGILPEGEGRKVAGAAPTTAAARLAIRNAH